MFDLAPYRLSVNLSELARKCRISLVRWPLADPLGCFPVDAILPETKHAGSLNLGKPQPFQGAGAWPIQAARRVLDWSVGRSHNEI